ncbi:MAG: hypothetical protein H6579_07430 [Chitinophagales bacterium]|nr:hypothetical protein [Bacteroidota bacterium]MCB9256942.1 hypothetical protein [Chitinophagales bacterium]
MKARNTTILILAFLFGMATLSSCKEDDPSDNTELCNDGIDNDGDGFIDCADFDCSGNSACGTAEICSDGIDNDLDGFIDCDDLDCDGDPACP